MKMDHLALIASLSPEQRRQLTLRQNGPGLWNLAWHLGGIVAMGWLIVEGVPGWWLLVPVQGVFIIFLFTLHHETIHRTAFASRRLNDWVARLCGFLIVLPSDWFRYFHFAHHRYTQNPERDPELATPKPENWWQYAKEISGVRVWSEHVKTLFRNALGGCRDDFVPRSGRAAVTRESRIMILAYITVAAASYLLESSVLLFSWVLPALIGQPFLRLYLMAEHGRCPSVSNMFENTRTTFTHWAVRKLAWNMPFHAEHHAYPSVPFHQLPEFHRFTRPHLKETERGYGRFHRRYAEEVLNAV